MDYTFDTCKSFLCWRSQNEVDPNIPCKFLITTLIDYSVANYFFSLQSFIPFIYGHREAKLLQSRFAKLLKEDLVSTIYFTVWKFHDFCITQILREINFEDSRSAKSAILTHSQALNFAFYAFLHLWKAENNQIYKILSPKNGKNDSFCT